MCLSLLLCSRSRKQNLSAVSTDSVWTVRQWSGVSTSTGCGEVTPLLCHRGILVLCVRFVCLWAALWKNGMWKCKYAQCFAIRLLYKDEQISHIKLYFFFVFLIVYRTISCKRAVKADGEIFPFSSLLHFS